MNSQTDERGKKIAAFFLLIFLLAGLGVSIILTQKNQDIRPKALQGQANLLLEGSAIKNSVNSGDSFDVLAAIEISNSNVRLSGADFIVLYNKNLLDVINVRPMTQAAFGNDAPFSDAPIVAYPGSYDTNYNFLRVAEVAKKTTANLPRGTVKLAWITFKAKSNGKADIKYPEDNKYLQFSGIGIGQ